MRTAPILLSGVAVLLSGAASWAQPVTVSYEDGLLSVQCADAPLASVFEAIEQQAGVELTLEDGVKSKRITASLQDVPVATAIRRLLEGVGVNFIVMMDPYDWNRVGKLFIGSGGGGSNRGGSGPMRGPVTPDPVEEAYEDVPPDMPDENMGMDGMEGDVGDTMDPGLEAPVEEAPQTDTFAPTDDPGGEFPVPGSSPLPDYLPPAQTFPRSSFTPGLPARQPGVTQPVPGQQQQQMQPQEQDPNNAAPPAMFPFTDAFGRPIPIPPGTNQQQQQQQKRQQQRDQ